MSNGGGPGQPGGVGSSDRTLRGSSRPDVSLRAVVIGSVPSLARSIRTGAERGAARADADLSKAKSFGD